MPPRAFQRAASTEVGELKIWIEDLESDDLNVFFSAPLDLDLLMYNSFPNVFQTCLFGGRGPNKLYSSTDDKAEKLEALFSRVLGTKAPSRKYNGGQLGNRSHPFEE